MRARRTLPARRLAPALAALAGLLAALPAPAAAADAPATLMIVFDGSGSMWGKLASEREPKFALAREGLREPLEKAQGTLRVGLASFGHRRKSDCTDFEVILAPEAGEASRIITPLEKLNPKGKGPLVAALREAAGSLAGRPGAQAMLLIHDDPDNCQQDPCAAAEEIHRSAPALAIHVVSIGMRKEDAQRMACIAKTTGGRHLEASDAASLSEGLAAIVQLASAADPQRPPAGPRAPAAAKAAPAPAAAEKPPARPPVAPSALRADGPAGLSLTATLGATGDRLEAPVRWRVFKAGTPGGTPLAETIGAGAELAIPPGRYAIEAQHGLVGGRAEVEVKPQGLTPLAVAIDAGTLRLRSLLAKDAKPSPTAIVTVSEAAGGKSRTVWIGREAEGEIVLPAGTYAVATEDGLARLQQTVTIAAGSRIELDLVVGAGTLRVAVLGREGGKPLDGASLEVSEDDPDAARGRRAIVRSATADASFLLPAGTYLLTARRGAAELRERVVVRAGEEVRRTLVLNVGRLEVGTAVAGALSPLSEGVTHRVLQLDGERREAARTAGPQALFDLPSGRYRVESRIGTLNALSTRELEVRPGSEQRLTVEFRAGQVRLKLAESLAAAYNDVAWHIRDMAGNSVWRTVQAEPRAVLAAGRYVVLAETRDRRIERAIEVRSGESRVIELAPE